MQTVRFTTQLDGGRVIHIPDGVAVEPGRVEIEIRPQPPREELTEEEVIAANKRLIARMARAAEELGVTGLPSDLAENHDHYIHGLPKGIDRQ